MHTILMWQGTLQRTHTMILDNTAQEQLDPEIWCGRVLSRRPHHVSIEWPSICVIDGTLGNEGPRAGLIG
ncbi:hypothetical protein LSAT2_004779 [Lamellibrachia satsuma]|nr:hypothetical protein LSAT2_004779 [Lamellibrachia satsuma]